MPRPPATSRREVLEWVVATALGGDAGGAVVVVHGDGPAAAGGVGEVLGLPVLIECDTDTDDLVEVRRWECGAYAPVVEAARYVLWDGTGALDQELYHRLRCCGVGPRHSATAVRAALSPVRQQGETGGA